MAQASLIYDRIGFVSVQPLLPKFRLQGYKHYIVSDTNQVITEDGEDCDSILSKPWDDSEVRSRALSVVIKGKVHKLIPAFKIERGLEPHHISRAFGIVESEFVNKMKEGFGEDPEAIHLEVLNKYPSRLAKNDYFKPLAETDYKPSYK